MVTVPIAKRFVRCQVTPLLALFGHSRSDQCRQENSKETINVLLNHGANISVPAPSFAIVPSCCPPFVRETCV